MIAINGKPMNDYPSNDPLRVHIEKGLDAIRKRENWVFDFDSRFKSKAETDTAGSYEETSAGISFVSTIKYVFGGIENDITYATNIKTGKYGEVTFEPRRQKFTERVVMNSKKEADKIFLFACLSPYCEPFIELSEWNNPNPQSPAYWKVEDLVGEAEREAEFENNINKARQVIYGPEGLGEDDLRLIAGAYGLKNTETLDINLLKRSLKNKIFAIQKNGKYNMKLISDFLSDSKVSNGPEIRSAVKEAFEAGYIEVKITRSKATWYYIENNNYAKQICNVPTGADPKTTLIQFLVKNQNKAEEFLENIKDYRLEDEAEKKKEENIKKTEDITIHDVTDKFDDLDDLDEGEKVDKTEKDTPKKVGAKKK